MNISSQLCTTHHGAGFSDLSQSSGSLPFRPHVTSNEAPLPSPVSSSSVSLQSLTSVSDTFLTLVASDTATHQPSAYSVTVPLHPPLALETDAPQHIVGDTLKPTGAIYPSASNSGKSPSPAKSNVKVPQYKTVPALNFRCNYCYMCCTTDESFRKHLSSVHQINDELPVEHYKSFIGKRKVRIPLNLKPTSSSVSNSGFELTTQKIETPGKIKGSFRCFVCDKTYASKDGAKRHMKKIHNVTNVVPEDGGPKSQKTNQAGKVIPMFKTPLASTSCIEVSGPLPSSEFCSLNPTAKPVCGTTNSVTLTKPNETQKHISLPTRPKVLPSKPVVKSVKVKSNKKLEPKSNFGF